MVDRIDEVLAGKKFSSAREWCRKAGVSEGYIGALKTRTATGEVQAGNATQISALARAANVSVEWLMGDAPSLRTGATVDRLLGSAALEEVLARYPWPEDISMAVADAVIADARAEAHANGVDRPQNLWHVRVGQLIREHSGRAKTVHQRQVPAVDLEEESPELREHRARKQRR